MDSILRLFNAIEIKLKEKKENNEILKETIKNGFIFSPEIIANYSFQELQNFIKIVNKEIGLNAKQINNSFHKSWQKIKEANIEDLIFEQILHYFTTYGFESLGIYNKDFIFIPNEVLEIPDIKIDEIKLIVIKGYTKEEIKNKLLELLNSGIAFKDKTKKDILDISLYIGLNEEEIFNIKNKEVKIVLYDYLNIFPKNNVEFLRYIIYKSTEKTLIIKNKKLIEEIKSKQNINILGLLENYNKKYGLEKLAEIFYRYKPLWIAFRTNKGLKIIINKIRRLAKKNHKPMQEDFLNSITGMIKNNKIIDINKLKIELGKVNVFRKIRLANALKFRMNEIISILFKIRNGKGYAKEYNFDNKTNLKLIYNIVIDSIIEKIKLENKKIYIPKFIEYALPSTEKQFIGNIPFGTCIKIDKDLIFGVHWENDKTNRIDLDLSMINNETKIGWNSYYRNESKSILFSGDMTDAKLPNGASELFYINIKNEEDYIFYLNFFNYYEVDLPFSIIVAKEKVDNLNKNYMVNPNNILAKIKTIINTKQKMLGYLKTGNKENRFYFSEIIIGKSNVSRNTEYSCHIKNYLRDYYKSIITLNSILEKANAIIVNKKEDCDIDLSLENLEKDTIINLLI